MSYLDALDRPIAFHRIFRTVSGSTVAALFLSQAWYWSKRLPDERDGWFYKTQAEWETETGLSRSEQETARRHLTRLGILEEKREGLPARLWFRIDRNRLESLIDDAIKSAGTPQSGSTEPSTPVGENPADIHTETTAETTTPRADARSQNVRRRKTPTPKQTGELPANGPAQQIVRVFCEAVGLSQPTNYRKAVGQAQQLVNVGVTPGDIPRAVAWCRSQKWLADGFDLGTVMSQADKWRAAPQQSTVRRFLV